MNSEKDWWWITAWFHRLMELLGTILRTLDLKTPLQCRTFLFCVASYDEETTSERNQRRPPTGIASWSQAGEVKRVEAGTWLLFRESDHELKFSRDSEWSFVISYRFRRKPYTSCYFTGKLTFLTRRLKLIWTNSVCIHSHKNTQ